MKKIMHSDGVSHEVSIPKGYAGPENILGFKVHEFKSSSLPVELYELHDVYMKFDSSGARYFTKDKVEILEASDYLNPTDWLMADLSRNDINGLMSISDTTFSLVPFKAKSNFSHWLLEGIPKASLLNVVLDKVDSLLLDNAFIEQTIIALSKLNVDRPRGYIGIGDYGVLFFKKLYVTNSLKHPVHNAHPTLMSIFKASEKLDTIGSPKRIYIDRAKGRRGVENDFELLELLEKYDFKVIVLETLSFEQQATLFSGAEIILAVHGAGLSNIVFSKMKKLSVIEILPSAYATPAFWYLASMLNIDYRVVGEITPWNVLSNGGDKFNDLLVDMPSLESTIQSVIKEQG